MVILMTLPLVINNKVGTKTVNKIPPNGKTLFPGKTWQ